MARKRSLCVCVCFNFMALLKASLKHPKIGERRKRMKRVSGINFGTIFGPQSRFGNGPEKRVS